MWTAERKDIVRTARNEMRWTLVGWGMLIGTFALDLMGVPLVTDIMLVALIVSVSGKLLNLQDTINKYEDEERIS